MCSFLPERFLWRILSVRCNLAPRPALLPPLSSTLLVVSDLLALDAHSPLLFSLTMSSQSTTTTTAYSRSYAQANPIDLTLDDDDEGSHNTERMAKRPCTMSRSFNAAFAPSGNNPPLTRHQSTSGLSPAMSLSTLAPHAAPSIPSGSQTQYQPQAPSYYPSPGGPIPNTVRPPVFQGPSTSDAFFQPRPQAVPSMNPLGSAHPLHPQPLAGPSSNSAARQVIDLTDSPSPPPSHISRSQPQRQLHETMGNLPIDLPPKTPVCIGVLPATALVLYPIPYVIPQDPNGMDAEWAPVRLQYEQHSENRPASPTENINVRPPSCKSPTGEVIPGEVFAVVEQKVATPLGPMLGKGLIRLDAKIRRTHNVSTRMVPCEPELMLHSCRWCNSKC